MNKIVHLERFRARRSDDFVNRITSYGTKRDHKQQFQWHPEAPLSKHTLETMHAQHPIAWKISDLLSEAALAESISIDSDASQEVDAFLNELMVTTSQGSQMGFDVAMQEASIMAYGVHGGAGIYLDIDDGQDVEMPVNLNNVRQIRGAHVIEKDYLYAQDLTRSMRFEHWILHDRHPGEIAESTDGLMRIHKSRIIQFPGLTVSRDVRIRNNGWGISRIERCKWPLLVYSIAHNLTPNIIKEFISDVIKLQGLNQLSIGECVEDQQAFDDRMDAMFLAKSMLNKLVLDADDDYQKSTTSVAGLTDLINNPERALVQASGIPHTILLGESPGSSLSQSGAAQDRQWKQMIKAYQRNYLRPQYTHMLKLVGAHLKTGPLPFTFPPLDTPSKKEQLEQLEKAASALERLIRNQIITPSEGATMFKNGELAVLPTLDEDTRSLMNGIDNNVREENESAR